MKKFKVIFTVILALFTLSFSALGCSKENKLKDNVIELRSNLYESDSDFYKLKASYGFKKNAQGERVYLLTFKLLDKQSENVTYSISLLYDGLNYQSDFTLDPVKHALTVQFEIDNFNLSTFETTVLSSSSAEKVTFHSILPENTIDYLKALDYFEADQKTLIENRTVNGEFTSDLILRVIVKDGKAYWYVGILESNGNLKALLLDGQSGKTLAIREVF